MLGHFEIKKELVLGLLRSINVDKFPGPDGIYPRPDQTPSADALIRLTKRVLILNNFSFNCSYFLQTKGVAMGTRMCPSYACLFVGYVEQSLFRSYT
eukprot:g23846.t1